MHYNKLKSKLKRNVLSGLMVLMLSVTALTGCSSNNTENSTTSSPASTTDSASQSADSTTTNSSDYSSYIKGADLVASYDEHDSNENWQNTSYEEVNLESTSITTNSSKVTVSDGVANITGAGTYHLSGTLDDGSIVVDAGKEDIVWLVLDNVSISNSTSSAIYVKNAKKVILTLADGSTNTLSDGTSYTYPDTATDEPNAAIFACDDLTINGSGSLTVNGNYEDGIACKDELRIVNGTITVTAKDDGIRGKDALIVKEGTITVTSKGDGLKASNSTDPQKGYIILEGGTVTINSENDGVQAESSLLIKDGIYNITTTGTIASSSDTASSNTEATSDSFKALKATSDIYVTGGTFVIDSSDDAVHSNNTVTIEDGSFTITSADDGMHADDALTINGGTIDILKSYEGLEGASIVINNGTISLVATDDGINAAGGSDSTENPGMFGKDHFSSSGNYFLEINGGSLHVNADGDGLDANGYIKQTGGTVTVDGPTNGGNGALDYDSTYDISGGILIATGSQDMAMATSSSSTQNTIYIAYTSRQAANQMITLKDASGNTIYSYTPSKEYQSVVISTPDIVLNETYSLYSGDTKLCDVTPTSNVASFSDTGETVSTPTGMNGMGGGGGRGQMGGDKGQMGERPDRGTTDGSAPGTTDGEPPVMPSGDPAGLQIMTI